MDIKADPKVMIIKNRAPPQRPLVSVTVRASGTQVRIAFNAALVRQASLQDVPWMAIAFDKKRQRVTFISTPSREYQGDYVAFPLLRDGGGTSRNTSGKALNVPTDLFSMLYQQAPRRYEPQIQPSRAGPEISIALEPAPASYADNEAWLGGGGQTEAKRRAAPLVGKRSEVKPSKLFVGSRETAEATQYRQGTAFIMMWMDKSQPDLVDVLDAAKDVFGQFRIRAVRADDIEHEGSITSRVLTEIATAEFCFADLTGSRPSVYYEVGYAHALRRRVLLFRKAGTELHFDLVGYNCPQYNNLRDLKDKLTLRLREMTNEELKKPDGHA